MKFTKAIRLGHNGLLRKKPNSEHFKVCENFYWYLDYITKAETIIVPIGFKTNFGSIPRLLRFFFNPIFFISYILHDYLYSKDAVIILEDGTTRKPTRYEADYILLQSLNLEGAGLFEKLCIYIGVRLFGSLHFKK